MFKDLPDLVHHYSVGLFAFKLHNLIIFFLFIYINILCWLPGSLHKYASEVKILTRTGECNKSSTDKTVSGDNENDQSGETCQGMPSTH